MASTATLLAVAIAIAIALAGCGGSSGPSLSAFKSGFTADRAQFRKLGLDLQSEITGVKTKTDLQKLVSAFNAVAADRGRSPSPRPRTTGRPRRARPSRCCGTQPRSRRATRH